MMQVTVKCEGSTAIIEVASLDVLEAVHTAFRALAGVGFHPGSVAEAMEEVGREYLDSLTPGT